MIIHLFNTDTFFNNAYKTFFALSLIAAVLAHFPAVYAETRANSPTPLNALLQSKQLVVYKSPTCGCCGDWAEHMSETGFNTKIQHPKDLNTI